MNEETRSSAKTICRRREPQRNTELEARSATDPIALIAQATHAFANYTCAGSFHGIVGMKCSIEICLIV